MRISRRIFISLTFSFFISVLIKFIFFNSNRRFIYLKKYLNEVKYNNENINKNNFKKLYFSEVEIDQLIVKDFKKNRLLNINGWILSESEIYLALFYDNS